MVYKWSKNILQHKPVVGSRIINYWTCVQINNRHVGIIVDNFHVYIYNATKTIILPKYSRITTISTINKSCNHMVLYSNNVGDSDIKLWSTISQEIKIVII